MSVYIIRPKTSIARSGFVASRQFTPESREAQVRGVVRFWRENPVHQQIESWLKNASREVLIFPHDLGITGTTIVEMPDDEAKRMEREFSDDLIILRDRPIELIQPVHKAGARNELPETELWHLQDINLFDKKGQRTSEFTGKNITVAVLDTGIDSEHQELHNNVIASYTMSAEGDIISSGHSESEIDAHGTHVGGSICGSRVGVAPDTKLIDCLFIPGGTGSLTDLVLWLDRLPEKRPDVDIVNISGGIRNEFIPEINYLIDTLIEVNILPVCAIGNDGFNNHMTPANWKNSLSVGASNQNRQVASFSGNATMYINNCQLYNVPYLVAPGVQVYSSVPGGLYEAWNGTSMATAITSGVAALYLEYYNRHISVGSLVNKIRCITLVGESRERQGRGLIQVP